jgi:hypothetical protein
MYDLDDLFQEPRLADILERSVHLAITAKQHGKNMCMNVHDFLQQARNAALSCHDGTVVAEFDELNDMLMVHVADADKTETYAVAAPRNPENEHEELVLAAMQSSDGLRAFEKALRMPVQEKESEAEMSDDELESLATQLDGLAVQATNYAEVSKIVTAAHQIRSLKGE